jgi:hypothetical protein
MRSERLTGKRGKVMAARGVKGKGREAHLVSLEMASMAFLPGRVDVRT